MQKAVLAAVALAFMATWPAAGHAHVGRQAPAGFVADLVHLAAMATWLGGLTMLLTCVLASRRVGGQGRAAVTALPRFSRTALVCVAVLVATGVYQAWRQIGGWAPLVDTTYGLLVLAKAATLAVIVAFAVASRSVVQKRYVQPAIEALSVREMAPGLSAVPVGSAGGAPPVTTSAGEVAAPGEGVPAGTAGAGSGEQDQASANPKLRRSVAAEFALAAVVLGVTSVLVATSPGDAAAMSGTGPMGDMEHMEEAPGGMQEGQEAGPYATTLTRPEGGTVHVRVMPARTGKDTVTVTVRNAAGAAAAVPEVTAEMTLSSHDLGPLPVRMGKHGRGVFRGTVTVPLAGQWLLDVIVRTSDIDEHMLTTQVPIR